MFLIHNERTKLTANWLNTLATAVVAAGVFAPGAALIYGFSQTAADRTFLGASAAICFLAGFALHMAGRVLLGRLRE